MNQSTLDVIASTSNYACLPVNTRCAQPGDVQLLVGLLCQASEHSRYLRYFQPLQPVSSRFWAEAERMVKQNTRHGITLIATIQPECPEVIAVAELARDMAAPQQGEIAMLVRDDFQGQGLGGMLGRQTVTMAQNCGLTHLHADLLAENRASLRLLRHFGVPYATSFASGVRHAVLHISKRPELVLGHEL